MTAMFHFLEVLVLSVAALIALTLVLIVVVACLPRSPLKDVLAAFAKRIGATAAVTLVAIPVETIPGVDAVYDVVGFVVLVAYWLTLFNALRTALASQRTVVGHGVESRSAIVAQSDHDG